MRDAGHRLASASAPKHEETSAWWLQLLRRIRKRIETVSSQLEYHFGLAETRTRDVWHLTTQVTRKLLAHTNRGLVQSPTRA
ncbi:MAG: transposase [Candidatus Competibacteraceae bacterium]|nr:transposase [Candidatus Competibacteraceae bacterium]